jgi:hypothetical protein
MSAQAEKVSYAKVVKSLSQSADDQEKDKVLSKTGPTMNSVAEAQTETAPSAGNFTFFS